MKETATYRELAGMIDHALLRPDMTVAEIEAGIELAARFEVASVCVQPWYVERCARRLSGAPALTSTVIGFPHGGHTVATKLAEAREAMMNGARELDMVVNIAAVCSEEWGLVAEEIAMVAEAAHGGGALVKVIFENCWLSDGMKVRLCEICSGAGADWVKTSTGFGSGGALDPDIALMREHCPSRVGLKASGGIRTLERMLRLRELGADRIGTSSTKSILEEAKNICSAGVV